MSDNPPIRITKDGIREVATHINGDPNSGGPIDATELIAFIRDSNLDLYDEIQSLILNAFINNEAESKTT